MPVRPVVLWDSPNGGVLRQKSKKVKRVDDSIRGLVKDLVDTMRAAPGLGLSAPQIGVLLRVVVVEIEEKLTVLVNPEILRTEGEWEPVEGCLSIPGYQANVKRAYKVVAKGRNQLGKETRVRAEGLFAQALQHEIDHLDGKLYIDYLESLDQLRPVEPRRVGEGADASREPVLVG